MFCQAPWPTCTGAGCCTAARLGSFCGDQLLVHIYRLLVLLIHVHNACIYLYIYIYRERERYIHIRISVCIYHYRLVIILFIISCLLAPVSLGPEAARLSTRSGGVHRNISPSHRRGTLKEVPRKYYFQVT